MNKVKMFFVAAALVLATAGVFAGKSKFSSFTLYAYDPVGGTRTQIIASGLSSVTGFNVGTGSNPAQITSSLHGAVTYYLQAYDVTLGYKYLYSTSF